ncbi:MAG: porin, partial [Candidatus Aminicenantales bacterium]
RPGLAWQDGPVIRLDKQSWLRLGALIQADFGWIDGHGLGRQINKDLDDKFEWRRIRPYILGQLGENIRFKIEANFSPPSPVLDDAYVQILNIPAVGTMTIGHFKEPFSLDELTGSANTTFLERALPNALAPSYNFGIGLNNTAFNERMTWAAGVFQNDDRTWAAAKGEGDAEAFTGRVTFLPWYENDGSDLVHLGAAYSFRRPEEPISFSQRPEAHFLPSFTNTKSIDANQVHLIGTEAAWVRGPFTLQGQYTDTLVDSSDKGQLFFQGAYAQAGYFLTGEVRPYDRQRGVFTAVRPKKDFLASGGGLGAWEVAGRYSFLERALPNALAPSYNFGIGLNNTAFNERMTWA